MAVDRLAFYVQFNQGNVDVEGLKKFLPTFFLGDTKKKQEMFVQFVYLFSETVSQCAKEMYFKTKNGPSTELFVSSVTPMLSESDISI